MDGFRFKQFTVCHASCAMKVGTDGILLGAWASLNPCSRILDLGTGSGLIALMLAQRYPKAKIIGVEVEPNAAAQAKQNVAQSPWADRIQIKQQAIQTFVDNCQLKQEFDLIVANPPYFPPALECASKARDLARIRQQSHFSWLSLAQSCLSESGKICFILPFEAGCLLKTQAKQTALYCTEQLNIITKQGKAPRRMLLSFAHQPAPLLEQSLIIYDQQNQYSVEYKQLTQAFYLNF